MKIDTYSNNGSIILEIFEYNKDDFKLLKMIMIFLGGFNTWYYYNNNKKHMLVNLDKNNVKDAEEYVFEELQWKEHMTIKENK